MTVKTELERLKKQKEDLEESYDLGEELKLTIESPKFTLELV